MEITTNLLQEFYSNNLPDWISLTINNRIFPSETGLFDLNSFLKALIEIDFDGYYCLEVLNREHIYHSAKNVTINGKISMVNLLRRLGLEYEIIRINH